MRIFSHVNAKTIDEAVVILTKGDTTVISGGTDLMPWLRNMLSPKSPAIVANLKTIQGLDYIREEGGNLKIGALTTITQIQKSSVVQTKYTALAQAAHRVGPPQLRNTGTIEGNICQYNRCWYYRGEHNAFNCLKRNPAGICYALIGDNRYHSIFGATNGCISVNESDTAPALVAFGATVVTNKRRIPIGDFFDVKVAPNGEGSTVLAGDEIVTEIEVPAAPALSRVPLR